MAKWNIAKEVYTMLCPLCSCEPMRVIPMVACSCCGCPILFCGNCFHRFIVRHDDKNKGLLPPQAELEDFGSPISDEVLLHKDKLIKAGLLPDPSMLPTVDELHHLIAVFGGTLSEIFQKLEEVQEDLRSRTDKGEALSELDQLKLEFADRWLAQ